MTPEERAKAVLDTFWHPPGFGPGPSQIDAVAATIREAVRAEREACARIAQTMPRSWDVDAPDPQTRIAAAIRARANP